MGIDADLKRLLGREGITFQALQCYQHWRRGFSILKISNFFGINPEDTKAGILHVQQLIPERILHWDIKMREELIRLEIQSKEMLQRLHELFSKSPESYLESGRDPAVALRKLRKFINAEISDEELPLRRGENGYQ